jgi:hypothetical protein
MIKMGTRKLLSSLIARTFASDSSNTHTGGDSKVKKTCSILRWGLLLPVLIFSIWGARPAKADDAPKADDTPKIALSGLLDMYYQYSFAHPPIGAAVNGRSFDVKNDSFSLSLLELNATRAVTAKSPLGFTATFTLGKTADLVNATEPGGTNTYKYLQQLYATYLLNKTTVDFGKFVTMMGYEVIESSSNDNYSRGLLFTYAIPFYHMGFRITQPISSTLTAQFHLVNGWNDVEDDNGGKSIGTQLNWTPNSKVNLILNWMGGDEGGSNSGGGIGFATPGIRNTQTLDLVGIYNVTPVIKLGMNVDYASAGGKGGSSSGHWSGEAVYARYQMPRNNAVALRMEHFEDSNGLRTGVAQNMNEITVTAEHVWHSNLVSRLEFRHDYAGSAYFNSGGGMGHDQDTLTFAQVVKY